MTLTISSLIYALIICFLFYIVSKSNRKYLLALASVVYIFNLNKMAGFYVILTGILCWGAGALIGICKKNEQIKAAKILCVISVIIFAGSLLVLKYMTVYYPSVLETETVFKYLIMPIGFSFYIFQAISYVIDVKRGSVTAATNPVDILLYLSFFPKFVSGPIERYDNFKAQIKSLTETNFRDAQKWKKALYYTLVGCFMKLVIADRLVVYVNRLFEGYEWYGSILLLLGSLFYTIEIYCDFAGYSYVAIGISAMFDVSLAENFRQPYMSTNITEFWRRWHMSLSRWFTDYIYIPLGGNRKGLSRKILNTFIVFFICGMWHGAGKNFIVWGLLHGVFSAIDVIAREKKWVTLRNGATGRIVAFIEASFAWIFFKASSLTSAVKYIIAMLTNGLMLDELPGQLKRLELVSPETKVICVFIIVMIILDVIAYKKNCHIPELIAKMPQGRRYICFYLLLVVVVIFGIYGPDLGIKPIYMGF